MIDRKEVEIFNQPHQMYAEGKHSFEPHVLDIRELLESEGYISWDYYISYDSMMGLYTWDCRIKKKGGE